MGRTGRAEIKENYVLKNSSFSLGDCERSQKISQIFISRSSPVAQPDEALVYKPNFGDNMNEWLPLKLLLQLIMNKIRFLKNITSIKRLTYWIYKLMSSLDWGANVSNAGIFWALFVNNSPKGAVILEVIAVITLRITQGDILYLRLWVVIVQVCVGRVVGVVRFIQQLDRQNTT